MHSTETWFERGSGLYPWIFSYFQLPMFLFVLVYKYGLICI
jgi:hypothetical protein